MPFSHIQTHTHTLAFLSLRGLLMTKYINQLPNHNPDLNLIPTLKMWGLAKIFTLPKTDWFWVLDL